jgi:hypothetical protein
MIDPINDPENFCDPLTGPIFSILPARNNWQQINEFVRQVKERTELLRHAVRDADMESIRESCEFLSLMAAGYGFPEVVYAASDALRDMGTNAGVDEVRGQIEALIGICDRVRATTPLSSDV